MASRESRSRVLEKGLDMESRHILIRTNQDGETKIFFVLSEQFGEPVKIYDLNHCLIDVKVSNAVRRDLESEIYSGVPFHILAEVQGKEIELREIDSSGRCKIVPGEQLVPHKEIGLPSDVLGGDFSKHQNVFRVYVENNVNQLIKFGYHPSSSAIELPTRFSMKNVLELNVIPSLSFECEETYLLLWQYLLGNKLQAKSDQNHFIVGQRLAHRLQEIELGHVQDWEAFLKSKGLTMWEVEARKFRLERFVKKIDNKRKVFGESDEGRLLLQNYIQGLVKEMDVALELWAWYSWEKIGESDYYNHERSVEEDTLFAIACQLEKPVSWPAGQLKNQGNWSANPEDYI
jgi:hypothetical protein